MKRRRILIAGLGLLGALVVAALAVLVWVGTTERGARFVLDRAIAATGGALTVGGFEGSFSDRIVLTDIRYRDGRRDVGIDRLVLGLDIANLVRGVLVVDELQSAVVRYRDLAADENGSDDNDGGGEAFSLPIAVRIDHAAIAGIEVATDDGAVAVERIVLSGLAGGAAARIERLEFRVLGFFLSMQGNLGWADGFDVTGLVSWSGEIDGEPWLGSAELDGRWPELGIEQELIEPVAQSASGTVSLGATPAFELDIAWPGLGELAVTGELDADGSTWRTRIAGSDLVPAAVVPGWPGRWRIAGSLSASFADGYRVASDDLRLEGVLGDQQLDLELAGSLAEPATVDIERLSATLGANRAELAGRIGDSLELTLAAELDDLPALAALAASAGVESPEGAAAFAAALSGRATADLAISGTPAAPLVAGSARLEESSYAGLPLELALDFATPAPGETAIAIDRLGARLGASRVSGSGTFGAALLTAGADWRAADAAIDFALEATLDDLAELAALAGREEIRALIGRELPLAGLGGSAQARLDIGGSAAQPTLDSALEIDDLVYDRLAVSAASLDAELGLYPGGPATFALEATADDWSGRFDAGGRLQSGRWQGTLDSLVFNEPWFGDWTLESPTGLVLGPGLVELDNACLAHGTSSVCGEWRYGGQTDRLRLTADDFELAVLNPLLPPLVTLDGRISLAADLDSPAGPPAAIPAGTLSVRGGDIGIELAVSETEQVAATLESITLDAALEAYALELTAAVDSVTGGRANLSLATADLRSDDAEIGGRVEIFWPDLAALTLLSPDVGEVGGTLSIVIEAAGTAANPRLGGSAALNEGRVAIPAWGVLVERIEGEARTPEGSILTYSSRGFVEDSEIRLSGVTELDPAAGWPTRLTLTGDNVPVARQPDATVFASPDFDIDLALPRIAVSGRVVVPEAELSVEELPPQAVQVSPDSVVHGQVQTEPVRPLELMADVTVELGDNVRYTGSNLDTDLAGSLRLRYESGLSPIATGSVMLSGSYDAYGQSLALESGELLFAGPLDDPALNVLATRRIGATRVGIRLRGTLLAPEPSLFSEPQLSEANTLSYLMFGRPLSDSEDDDAATLESTALALGLQQALPAVQRVGESLGLDELSIEPTEVDASSLMAGKYLSPRVYMSYTYGLFNRLGGFLLRYDINNRFSLETRSGDEKSMDLLYSIEKE